MVTVVLTVIYCLTIVVALTTLLCTPALFTGNIYKDCFAVSGSDLPVSSRTLNAVNITLEMYNVIVSGLAIHILGFFCDLSFVFRIKS